MSVEPVVEPGALVLLDAELAFGDCCPAALARPAGRRGVLDAGVGGCHSLQKGDREKERQEGGVVRRLVDKVSDGCTRGAGRAKKDMACGSTFIWVMLGGRERPSLAHPLRNASRAVSINRCRFDFAKTDFINSAGHFLAT